MRLFMPGFVAKILYPDAIFRLRTSEKLLCLTFDDGPDPYSTPVLLDILSKRQIRAIFFCAGNAAEKYPYLIEQIRTRGHLIGNHGYSHLNGWTTSVKNYVTDISKATPITSSVLFRPPYGRLRFSQYVKLKEDYKIIFWDIMSYDFDASFGVYNSLDILKRKIRPGSIIVFHDKRNNDLYKLVEEFISFAYDEGFSFVNSL